MRGALFCAAAAAAATGSPSGLEVIHKALRPARHRTGLPLRPPGPQTLLAPHGQPQHSSTTVGVGGAGATAVGADADHVPVVASVVAVEGRQQEALVAQQAVQIAALEAKVEKLVQKTKRQDMFAAAYAGKRGRYDGLPLRVTRCV